LESNQEDNNNQGTNFIDDDDKDETCQLAN